MPPHLVVVENTADWQASFPSMQVVTVKDYISQPYYFSLKNVRVINLCRSYRYLSRGYYCSLLAEARRHKVIPSVRTLRDLSSKAIYSLDTDSLDDLLHKILGKHEGNNPTVLETYILFGFCDKPELKKIARQIFATFSCPLMKVEFNYSGSWHISSIKPLHLNALSEEQYPLFIEALQTYTRNLSTPEKNKQVTRYDLAILYDPNEKLPPSDAETLEKFITIGSELGIDVDLIKKKDYARLAEYDALFIRETTNIDHHTYRFAKKAESEGMVVIDDPDSILRCTNKVYLAELLKANNIPTPKTFILHRDNLHLLEREIAYPIVLKIPDGSFSRGVFKAETPEALLEMTNRLFKESDILLAQEYLYTAFDWRIGILNRKAIFACQYFMSEAHWQIVKHSSNGEFDYGTFRTFEVEDTPKKVIKTAVKAASQIGDGFYGVDLKQTDKGVVVIEINDNPNLDEGVENAVIKDKIYHIILKEFIRRIRKKQQR
ncbi:glutathione synthase/ribosomal protein S6 modification enzyme (glutaminyl transferase) [Beggiatoa alba B18LD]|uniref:Glutathione synthase/ribosomal protein S6 modification enzyme (Glutaminyl transferase) n=1 Tax=Beggiatoa alba B18LD TaxID=395493 RepID=I3CL37_9GAMM|nr:RimK family protein [Beggiatoa alba]EIJ44330.1 glutathione synthase/ribosomal protein S6 modification enzyme (glutaminyl transferase) [Beggiatoa alba B18LD]